MKKEIIQNNGDIPDLDVSDKYLELRLKFDYVNLKTEEGVPTNDYPLNLSREIYTLWVTYPLGVLVKIRLDKNLINTKIDLIKIICKAYQEIYEEEMSDGLYSIWGHGLGDLGLNRMYIRKDGTIKLGVDS